MVPLWKAEILRLAFHNFGIMVIWEILSKKIMVRNYVISIKRLYLFQYWTSVIQVYINCALNLHDDEKGEGLFNVESQIKHL